ncbi:MAG: hypothetical protein AAFN44_14720, partial [Pseudomonadota bacterium]
MAARVIVKPALTPRKMFRLSKTRFSNGDLAHRVAEKMVPTAQLQAPAAPKPTPVHERPQHTLIGFQWSVHTILQTPRA